MKRQNTYPHARSCPAPVLGILNVMFYVYLLQNDETKEIYIGSTGDIKRRIAEHNKGGKKFTTRNEGVWKLIYTEIYKSPADAKLRESKLKHHGSGKHELLKRLKHSLST